MKPFLIVTVLLLSVATLAQKTSNTDSSFKKILSLVVESYSTNFSNVKGELLNRDAQSAEYECLLHLPGTETGSIAEYISEGDSSWSWKNALYQADDFAEAKEHFRKIFLMVRSTNPMLGHSVLSLAASYKAPEENIPFSTIRFAIYPALGPYKNVVVDLSMEYKVAYWETSLQVYNTAEEEHALHGR